MVAGAQLSVMTRAMEVSNERAAGEWQAEWEAIPGVFEATAACLVGARQVCEGMVVNEGRMRENLTADGGLVMSEAWMMALAPTLGRERAHDVVREACWHARDHGVSLGAALRHVRGSTSEAGTPEEFDPVGYLGEASLICESALGRWHAARDVPAFN